MNTAFFFSSLQGSECDPCSPRDPGADLTAHIQGLSTTPPSLVQHLRLLAGAMAGASRTPDSLGIVVRRLVSGLAGRSVTDATVHELARSLVAQLTGLTQTAMSTATTVRPLGAALVGTSSHTPVPVHPQLRARWRCIAHLVGQQSDDGEAGSIFMPMEPVSQVPVAERGAHAH